MLPVQASDTTIQELYGLLVDDEKRNDQIVDDVLMAMEEGRSPILLTERKEHLEKLHDRLKGFVRHIIILRGGRSAKERRKIEAQLASIPVDEERLILATGRYIGEVFDDARLDTLFLALPVSWKGTLVQYAGRLHRLHPGKHEVKNRGLGRQQGTDARENFRKTACRLSSHGVSGRRQRNVIGIVNEAQRLFHFGLPRYAYH